MAKIVKGIAAFSLAATVILAISYKVTSSGILLPLAITSGTIAYHFVMRLMVGLAFHATMRNKADYRKRWYQVSKREMAVYEKLKVKQWKRRMPTYDPALFDPRLHTWEEIVQAMCQAELVHETIVVLSFVPIVAGVWFGEYPVFVITSALAAMLDLMFVMVQRYNRQRVIKLMKYKEGKSRKDGREDDKGRVV